MKLSEYLFNRIEECDEYPQSRFGEEALDEWITEWYMSEFKDVRGNGLNPRSPPLWLSDYTVRKRRYSDVILPE